MFTYLQLLRNNPDYFRLWTAQAISFAGDWFSVIALSALVSDYAKDTPFAGSAISFLLLARFLPPLIVGPFAGVIVDRVNRKRVMIFSDIMRSLLVLLLLLADQPDKLWLIYLLIVLQSSLSALFETSASAIIPSVVNPKDLVTANIMGSVTWSVMLAVGAALGGVIASGFGTTAALVIDAFSFLVSALFITLIRPRRISGPVEHHHHAKSELGFVDGLRYVAQHPGMIGVLLIKAGGSIGSLDALMTIFATRLLFNTAQEGTQALGILYSAFGIGALLGPIFINRANDGSISRMRRLIIVAYALISTGWFFFSGAPTLALMTVAILIKSMGSSVYWTYSSVIIQKTTPDKFLGRLFSLDMMGFRLSTVLSIVITGWVIDQVGIDSVRNVVLGTALISLVPLVLWTLALPWMERQDQVAHAHIPVQVP
jgi:MFS family permease